MSTLSDVRTGVKTVLEAANSGLHVYEYEPDNVPEYPALILEPTPEIDYDLNIGGNSFLLELTGTLNVRMMSSAEGWAEIDKYTSPTGAESIKAGIETDRSLNGSADDAHVNFTDQVTRNRDAQEEWWVFSRRFNIQIAVTVA